MTPSEVLNAAADHLEEHGWCQGAFFIGSRCCASGAIRLVTSGHMGVPGPDSVRARTRLREYLSVPGCPVFSIFDWNDFAGRTKEEVIGAMREAAK